MIVWRKRMVGVIGVAEEEGRSVVGCHGYVNKGVSRHDLFRAIRHMAHLHLVLVALLLVIPVTVAKVFPCAMRHRKMRMMLDAAAATAAAAAATLSAATEPPGLNNPPRGEQRQDCGRESCNNHYVRISRRPTLVSAGCSATR